MTTATLPVKAGQPVTHHKAFAIGRGEERGVVKRRLILNPGSISDSGKPYRVSRFYRVLSPVLFRKRYQRIRDFLLYNLRLTDKQAEVTLRLLRLWAYYGLVYPKACQVADEPELAHDPHYIAWRSEHGLERPRGSYGISRATFWRTVRLLQDMGLLEVVNRYVAYKREDPEKSQTSNIYRLDRLLIAIARYLAEKGTGFLEKWLEPVISRPDFWQRFSAGEDPLKLLNPQLRFLGPAA